MAKLLLNNVSIRGVAACVPSNIEQNLDLPVFKNGEAVSRTMGLQPKEKILELL